jgi:hypothetical protein
MPNRIIKESICTSDNLNDLTPDEEVFFYRLIVNCDDFGRFDARPEILRAKLYPLRTDKEKLETVSKRLKSLVDAGLIIIYTNSGKQYLQFTTWDYHQHRRANNSKYPSPDDCDSRLIAHDGSCKQAQTDSPVNEKRKRETKTMSMGKIQFAEFVNLTNEEHSSLVAELGEHGTGRCIEILDNYKGASGKQYKSDYRAIRNWVIGRYKEENNKAPKERELPML